MGNDLTGRTLHVAAPDGDRAALAAWILAPGCCPVCGVEMRGKGACRSKACRSRKVKS